MDLEQSGDEGFVLANLYDDIKILRCAREEGKMLLESKDPNKVKLCRDIAYSLERWSKYICFKLIKKLFIEMLYDKMVMLN